MLLVPRGQRFIHEAAQGTRQPDQQTVSKLLIPNTTQVPNIIFDKLMANLRPGAFKVLLAICRYTYGHQKQSDRISLKQLEEMTGLNRWSVVRSAKELVGIVIIKSKGTAKGLASEYALNLEITTGELGTLSDQSHKVTSHLASHLGVTFQTNSKPNKDTVVFPEKKSKPAHIRKFDSQGFQKFYQAFPRHVAKAEAEKAWAQLAPGPDLAATIASAAERYAESVRDKDPEYIKHPAAWLRARRWEDELGRRREPKFINA